MLSQLRWPTIVLALITGDQLTKYWATRQGAVFLNYQFAFSTPVPVPVMYGIYVVILLVLVWYVSTHYLKFTGRERWAWALVAAGALSNTIERLFSGYVRDFIYLFSGVFNFADFYILLGIILLFIGSRPNKST